ncbi:hypothetical protein FRC17_004837 [Serendipita sp. 399]|nr:hypothetical protein FRC17_004837 [Serendipita sp. 399]
MSPLLYSFESIIFSWSTVVRSPWKRTRSPIRRLPVDLMQTNMFYGNLGLGSLASRTRVPTESERIRLRSILEIHAQVIDSLDQPILLAGKTFDEALGRWQKLVEEMESAQTELISARYVMESLRAHRESLSNEVHTLRGLLHPVRRVPGELLAQIFETVVHGQRYTAFHDATTLSHVCRAWRSAAIDHSSLWTTIRVDIGLSDSDIDMFAKTIAVRVGSLPVSLVLVSSLEADDQSSRRKLAIISGHLRVIRSLEAASSLGQRTILYDILSSFQRHAHSIQELDFSGEYVPNEGEKSIDIAEFFAPAVGKALCIRSIVLNGVRGFNARFYHDLPTLTHLAFLGSVKKIPLLYIVLRCPNLESLRIGDVKTDSTDLEEELIELENKVIRPIRQLSVDHASVLEEVASHIRMPRLQRLTVSVTTVADLQLGDLPELEYIRMPDLDPEDWAPFALAAPNITKMCTEGSGGVEVLTNWAGATNLIEPPFKKLETLEADLNLTSRHIDLDSFDDLVEKRCLPEEITRKLRDPDTAQIHTIEISYSQLRYPLMMKPWTESKYLKHARVVNSYETLRICWTRG